MRTAGRGQRARGTIGGLLVLLLLAVGCGTDDRAATSDGSAPSDDSVPEAPAATVAPTTSTTAPPGGRVPTADDPLRVLLAGDSVMAGLAPAVTAAVEGGGAATSTFVLTPALPHDGIDWAAWEARLAELEPEVVIVLVGVWERTHVDLSDPGFQPAYDTWVLDPFAEMVTDAGARLVWVGMPGVPNPQLSAEFAALNAALSAQADRWPDGEVRYVDGPAAVSAPDGSQPQVIPRPSGRFARVRQVDGTHLCADGSTLITRAVLDVLDEDWGVPAGEEWPAGAWRDGIGTPAQCPAP